MTTLPASGQAARWTAPLPNRWPLSAPRRACSGHRTARTTARRCSWRRRGTWRCGTGQCRHRRLESQWVRLAVLDRSNRLSCDRGRCSAAPGDLDAQQLDRQPGHRRCTADDHRFLPDPTATPLLTSSRRSLPQVLFAGPCGILRTRPQAVGRTCNSPTGSPVIAFSPVTGMAMARQRQVWCARNVWSLRNANSAGGPHIVFGYGWSTDRQIVGDWDGNGTFTPGVIPQATCGCCATATAQAPSGIVFGYGWATDKMVVGDWDGNGTFTPGVVRSRQWMLRNSNSSGSATGDVRVRADYRPAHHRRLGRQPHPHAWVFQMKLSGTCGTRTPQGQPTSASSTEHRPIDRSSVTGTADGRPRQTNTRALNRPETPYEAEPMMSVASPANPGPRDVRLAPLTRGPCTARSR